MTLDVVTEGMNQSLFLETQPILGKYVNLRNIQDNKHSPFNAIQNRKTRLLKLAARKLMIFKLHACLCFRYVFLCLMVHEMGRNM